jgi:predicted metalloenzyme YecM
VETFYKHAELFLKQMTEQLEVLNLDLSAYQLDHLCYRVTTSEQYETQKTQLCEWGQLLSEAKIGGRPIASFKLRKPVVGAGRLVWVIELPSPKSGRLYPTGFEHAEFVVPADLQEFAKELAHLNIEKDGLKKSHNPELKLALSPTMNIKFHQVALEQLILAESKPVRPADRP